MPLRLASLLLIALLLTAPGVLASEPVPEAHGEAAEGEAAKPESKIVELLPLYVPVLEGRRVVKYTIVEMNIEAAPSVATDGIKQALPRINDAMLIEAYQYAKQNESLDIEALRGQLLMAIETVLGPGQIAGLYLSGANDLNM